MGKEEEDKRGINEEEQMGWKQQRRSMRKGSREEKEEKVKRLKVKVEGKGERRGGGNKR